MTTSRNTLSSYLKVSILRDKKILRSENLLLQNLLSIFVGTFNLKILMGGDVVEWLESRTRFWRPSVRVPSPTTSWICFGVVPCSNPRPCFVNSQLVSLPANWVSSYIYTYLFILHGYITNSQYDQLSVGLIAQLVEHCTGIAEVMGSNPVQA